MFLHGLCVDKGPGTTWVLEYANATSLTMERWHTTEAPDLSGVGKTLNDTKCFFLVPPTLKSTSKSANGVSAKQPNLGGPDCLFS